MKVSRHDELRNATGTFGCPSCWPRELQGLVPGEPSCPLCSVFLEWDPETFKIRELWQRINERK